MATSRDQDQRLEAFFRREYRELYRYAYAIIGQPDDAQDVVQESLLRFYRLAVNGEVREHERALLFRVTRNLALDARRRAHTREAHGRAAQAGNLIPFPPAQPKTPEELLLEREEKDGIKTALGRLSQKEQDCLALRRAGLSYQEVAEMLALNPQSIGQTITRALRKFRTIYAEILEKKELDKTRLARRW